MAMFSRFSVFLRSGANPGTKAPGEPQILLPRTGVGQEVGVTPPDPEKYGTFAARWLYSQRNVIYWLGIQSKVPDTSQALYGSPGIANLPTSECQAILVVVEPQAVVEHVTQKTLLRTLRGVASATDAAAVLASHVAGE